MSRCKYNGRRGQCTHQSLDGSDYCRSHTNEDQRILGYLLSDPEHRNRLDIRADHDSGLQTLTGELSLTRMMLETRMNRAATADSIAEREALESSCQPLIAQIKVLVDSINKQSMLASQILGKDALMRLAEEIIQILTTELSEVPTRDEIIDKIAARLSKAVMEATNEAD